MTKAEIRKHFKEKRRSLTDSEMEKRADLMLISFQQMHLEIPDIVMGYAALESHREFDPHFIIDYCRFKNPAVEVAYPVINEDIYGLTAVLTKIDTAFIENKFGIEEPVSGSIIEPKKVEMIFVPLLAFDKKGHRVGYGKGYYDKFLHHCRPETIKIGFSFFDEPVQIDEIGIHDIALNFCVTPYQTFIF